MKPEKLFIITIAFIMALMLKTPCPAYDVEAVELYNAGIELTNQEKYEEAISSFEKAIEIEPEFNDAYFNLGILQEFTGKTDKALKNLEIVFKHNPNDYEVVYKIASIYHKRGDRKKALDLVKKIPENDPCYEKAEKIISSIRSKLEPAVYEGFQGPTGITRDSQGNLYVADYNENAIFMLDDTGERHLLAEGGLIKGPLGLATDRYDNIYVANYDSDGIIILPASDRTPLLLPYTVKKPYFLMIDDNDILYITEQGSNSVSRHVLDFKQDK